MNAYTYDLTPNSIGGFHDDDDADVIIGATIREKRDKLKRKQKRQGGRLSAADARELARLRAKIANDGNVFDDAWKATKTVVRSPVTKAAAGGLAIAFPAVGVPLATGLVAADRVIAATEGKKGAKAKAVATRAVIRTAAASKAGDQDARRGLELLAQVKGMSPSARASLRKLDEAERKAGKAKTSRRPPKRLPPQLRPAEPKPAAQVAKDASNRASLVKLATAAPRVAKGPVGLGQKAAGILITPTSIQHAEWARTK